MQGVNDLIEIELEQSPALAPMIIGTLFSRRPLRVPDGEHSPRIRASLKGQTVNPVRLNRYRDIF